MPLTPITPCGCGGAVVHHPHLTAVCPPALASAHVIPVVASGSWASGLGKSGQLWAL
jgi:hypothetical protein